VSLPPGSRFGPHEVTALIGIGGMGEVYRATDTRLKRDVAIKVLPAAVAADSDRLARFQREAEVLASLNHPNIAILHGLEDAGGSKALVMELVEGPTLADRIADGAIPIDEALPIARQIAEALEAAHEAGIVHRDLKPANVKVRPDGTVKVLDFGLAKPAERSAAFSPGLSMSPTITTPAMTQAGIIMGTAAYMSPEQARGKTVDRRSDIWAFGAVLYEMLTGRRLFVGADVTETVAQVVMGNPDWSALPARVPSRTRDALRRCLIRDLRHRAQSMGDIRIALEEDLAQPDPPAAASTHSTRGGWMTGGRGLATVAAAAAVVVAFVVAWALSRPTAESRPVVRVGIDLGANTMLDTDYGAAAVLSRDGSMLVFSNRETSSGRQLLRVRRLDQLAATPLAGTEGGRDVFFSPDGQWIGFFADGKLKKISATGGAAVTLCDVPDGRGGTWADDGTIVFAPNLGAGVSLMRVSAQGGKPEPFAPLDKSSGEVTQRWPQALAGRDTVLFTSSTITNNYENASIVAYSSSAGERKVVLRGGYHARYVASGHLVYMHEGTLFAAPFDLDGLKIAGDAVPVIVGVQTWNQSGAAQFSFSDNGSVVYLSGGDLPSLVSIYWLGKAGKPELLRGDANYFKIRFSPDGRLLATEILGQQNDIWVYDWQGDTLSRVTFDPLMDRNPAWTPDGQRIAFNSPRDTKGPLNMYWQRADGTGDVQRLSESPNNQGPQSWHPAGKVLAFWEQRAGTGFDIMLLHFDGDAAFRLKPGKIEPFAASPAFEAEAEFSPDGRWLAYQSDESGRTEIYVRPFPGPGGQRQVSAAGGQYPTWSRQRNELFYVTLDQRIWVAGYTTDGVSFRSEKPRAWSEETLADRGAGVRNVDLHPDGERFAILKTAGPRADATRLVLGLNVFEELRRLAPPAP
jgi:dipeptidyl aminopeptidase/acylaminoacyl peptidase